MQKCRFLRKLAKRKPPFLAAEFRWKRAVVLQYLKWINFQQSNLVVRTIFHLVRIQNLRHQGRLRVRSKIC